MVRRYIVPELGKLALAAVERTEVWELHHRLSHPPSIANTVVRTLSLMYKLVEDWGLVPEGRNSCRSMVKYPQRRRERILTDEEFHGLGQALDEVENQGGGSPSAVAATRLLMLTGCRKSEILTLRWDDVDRTAGEFRLRDGKRGPRMVPLVTPAPKVLDGIERVEGNPWVIWIQKSGIHLPGLNYYWNRIRDRAGLEGVRIHDLRHSHASRALALGEGLPIIGRLLGHRRVETTARYSHLARGTVRESAERIAVSSEADVL